MEINLRCTQCQEPCIITFNTLCELWKQGYEKLPATPETEVAVHTEITCQCGHVDTYDSPMFAYTFKIIFEDMVRE